MNVIVVGKVVEVEFREFKGEGGDTVKAFDAFLAPSNPRYGADRVSGPAEVAPAVGDSVVYRAAVNARGGARGPWLSVWCFEHADDVDVIAA
jgi:hypothetical protein